MCIHVVKSPQPSGGVAVELDPRGRAGFISWLGGFVRRFAEKRVARRRIRLCIDDLRGLDNRMLADIGIGRSEIAYLVCHGRKDGHRRMS